MVRRVSIDGVAYMRRSRNFLSLTLDSSPLLFVVVKNACEIATATAKTSRQFRTFTLLAFVFRSLLY